MMLLLGPVFSLLALSVPTASAYGERVHHAITATSLAADPASDLGAAAALDPAAMAGMRALIDARARSHPDRVLREAWVRRYPTPEAFDAAAMKEFLLLARGSTIYGIDRLDTPGATALEVAAQGAR